MKICIPEEIKNLGNPSPAAPILSPGGVFSPWEGAEGEELPARERANLHRAHTQNLDISPEIALIIRARRS